MKCLLFTTSNYKAVITKFRNRVGQIYSLPELVAKGNHLRGINSQQLVCILHE